MNVILAWLCQNTVAVALALPFVLLLARAFQARPAVQHVLWLVLLVKLLLPPLIEWPWSVESILASGQAASADVEAPLAATPPLPALEPITAIPEVVELPIAALPPPPLQPKPPITFAAIGEPIVAFWAVGCGLAFVVQLRRIARHRTLLRAGSKAPRHLDDEVGRVARQMGLRPLPTIVVPHITSPFVWCFGWLRLIWPEALSSESDVARSRGMIAHELAHVRRRDHWVAWLELAAGLIWWWNPLFWFVRRRLRESAEWACDALALAALPDERRAYAEMFLELSSSFKSGTPAPVLGMSTGAPSSFERRLTMILSERVSGKMSLRGILLAAVLALVLAPTWSIGQSSKPPASPPPLTDFEKRLLHELREREQAVQIHDANAKLQAAEADHAVALANWKQYHGPLVALVLNTISSAPKGDTSEVEAFLGGRIYRSKFIRLRTQPGADIFRIRAQEGDSKALFVGKVLRIDERELYFQAGKDVHKMTMHESLASALENKLDAASLEALHLTKRVDAEFAAQSSEEMKEMRDPVRVAQSVAQLRAAEARVEAAKARLDELLGKKPQSKNAPKDANELRENQLAMTQAQFESLLRGDAKLTNEKRNLIENFVAPENTLDLIENRIRLVVLQSTPKRIQMGDEAVAMYSVVGPKEVTFMGRRTGRTVLNLWIADEAGKQTLHSYLVRVFPDPDVRERLERVHKALELEIRREFPKSAVQLRSVDGTIILTGTVHDAAEATNIVRFVRDNAPGMGSREVRDDLQKRIGARIGTDSGPPSSPGPIVNLLRISSATDGGAARKNVNADQNKVKATISDTYDANIDRYLKLEVEWFQQKVQLARARADEEAVRTKLQTDRDNQELKALLEKTRDRVKSLESQVSTFEEVLRKARESLRDDAKRAVGVREKETFDKAAASDKSFKQAFLDGERKVAFSIDNKPWSHVIDWIVDHTGLSYIAVGAVPAGSFKFIGPQGATYTFPEVVDLVNEGLSLHHRALVRRAASFSIVSVDALRDRGLIPRVAIGDLGKRGKTEIVQILVPLAALNAEKIAPDVKKQLGPFGDVFPSKSTNQLLLSDSAGNLRRLLKTINDLEMAEQKETWAHKCLYVKAFQAELFLKDILAEPRLDTTLPGGPLGKLLDPATALPRRDEVVRVRSDDRTNTVFVSGPAKHIAHAKVYLAKFDQPQFAGQKPLVIDGTGKTPEARKDDPKADNVVIPLKNASAAEVAKILDKVFNGRVPNDRVHVVADPAANSLIVKAAPGDLAVLRDVVRRLDIDNNVPAQRPGGDARVLFLANVQAKEIAKVLTELFKKEVAQGLTIVAEPMTNSLLVRGTVAEQDAVAAVVRRLDEATHDRARPPIPAPTTPQEKAPAKKANSKEALIEQKLSLPISLNFQDVPLKRVVQDLSVMSGLNIVMDEAALKSKKISIEQPLALKVEDITLGAARHLLLRQAHLTYAVRNGVIDIAPDMANPRTP